MFSIFRSLQQYLQKQNVALKEVNDSRLQIYENLDVSIRDLEVEKHSLMVQTSSDKKFIKKWVGESFLDRLVLIKFSFSLKQSSETLELRIEELTKQIDELSYSLEQERRKNERLRESVSVESTVSAKSVIKVRHTSSASEPEHEEVGSVFPRLNLLLNLC